MYTDRYVDTWIYTVDALHELRRHGFSLAFRELGRGGMEARMQVRRKTYNLNHVQTPILVVVVLIKLCFHHLLDSWVDAIMGLVPLSHLFDNGSIPGKELLELDQAVAVVVNALQQLCGQVL